MNQRWIPVAAPSLVGNEKKYVMDCLETTWISSNGKYIQQFESAFAQFCGVKYAASCCNGTVALHLALLALGIGPGDEVLIPTLTFIATANAVTYTGATPILIDSEPQTWNIDPALLEAKITERTRAIIAVHIYGHPADMDAIWAVAKRHNLFVIEDAAEAHGAEYNNKRCGSLGHVGTFSFYGNKALTTGEGGMVTTDDPALDAKIRSLKGQGMDPKRRYWFPVIGYNYRMTNIEAAIGLAQLEKVDFHLDARRNIARWYREALQDVPGIIWQIEQSWAKSTQWMVSIVLDDTVSISRDDLMACLAEKGIETRPIFYPMHILPPYLSSDPFPVSDRLSQRGINLPTWAGLSQQDIQFISKSLASALSRGC
ncbi:MAG TPA: DegT/DnrJ/EryC1/StrS family aminotransferase [Aggregatilineaceae bacterium]|nr:DegT/DnrJ/EryC1/StrS family aminotransferase [Aggregatilineaceae bacterium]